MAILTSTITKIDHNISDDFLEYGDNETLITEFLKAEKQIAQIMSFTATQPFSFKAINPIDVKLAERIEILEQAMGPGIKVPKGREPELVALNVFFWKVFENVRSLFRGSNMLGRGLFISYSKHLYPYTVEMLKLQSDLIVATASYIKGKEIRGRFFTASTLTKIPLSIDISSLEEIQYLSKLHMLNAFCAGINDLVVNAKANQLLGQFVATNPNKNNPHAAQKLGEAEDLLNFTIRKAIGEAEKLLTSVPASYLAHSETKWSIENFIYDHLQWLRSTATFAK